MEQALNIPSLIEQQSAISSLAEMDRPDADALLSIWLDKLVAGTVPPAVQLDLLNAAKARGTAELLAKVTAFDNNRDSKDPLKDYRETLIGGDADRGREIFLTRTDVSCLRCHRVNGQGGEVGPDLSRIGLEKNRDYLLEAIVDPNKQIAKGFETVILQMADGKVHAGIIKQDSEQSIQLIQPDGKLVSLNKADIEERTTGKSGMPEDIVKKLSKSDLRDLVEFLSSLKSSSDSHAHGKAVK
jgi:quinoprotein glucose dehydrogenase